MANILITYGDENFKNSLWLLRRRAKRLGIFDKIITYTPDDLPHSVAASPLMLYKRGGGYWIWKPYIVNHTLEMAQPGDVVYFMDAGCSVQPSDEWAKYDSLIKEHDAIFFSYRSDHDYHWDSFGHNSIKIRHWCKPATAQYFSQYFTDGTDFMNFDSLWAGFFIVKKGRDLQVLRDWLDIWMFNPSLDADPYGPEKLSLPVDYNAHRHDQTALTFLVNYYKDKENIVILPETSESDREHAAVVAARYRVGKMSMLETLKFKLYHILKDKG